MEKPKKNNSRLVALSGIGIQMGLTIFIGAYGGKKLDEMYPMEKNWFTICGTILFVGIALYNVLRQVNRLNDQD